jgi:hypothetical protein
MLRIKTVLFLLMLFATAAAAAGQSQSIDREFLKAVTATACENFQASKQPTPPAIVAAEAEFIRQLHPAKLADEPEKAERGCGLIVRAGNLAQGRYVAAYQTIVYVPSGSGGVSEASRTVAVGLVNLAKDGSTATLAAKTAAPLELRPNEQLERFDLARYQLNEKETAFGLRSAIHEAYGGGGGADVYLTLFRENKGTLDVVLTALIASSNIVHGEERGNEKDAIIKVMPHKTSGVFDLEKSIAGRRQVWQWNGKAYATKDPEAVECVNPSCEDRD